MKVCIIGGCGHVGIPLGLAFAKKGLDVTLVDVNPKAVENINAAKLPFKEDGAAALLKAHVGKNLRATSDVEVVRKQDVVVFVTGTPVDEHLNPKIHDVMKVISIYLPLLNKKQLIVLRSTIFPGVTRIIEDQLKTHLGVANLATKEASATANGLTGILGYIGSSLSAIIVGLIADHFGWKMVFITFLLVGCLGIVNFIVMWKAPRDGYERSQKFTASMADKN